MRFFSTLPPIATALAAGLCLLPVATQAQLAAGLSLNFDANDPASGIDGNNWNSLTANATHNFDFGGDVTLQTVTSAGSGITEAYRFTGGAGDTNLPSWNGLFGDGVATTWEFWIKPSDTGDAGQTIYESGGSGTGYSIWYAPGTASDGSGTINFTIDGGGGTQIETVSAVIDTSDFRHVTCVYDRDYPGGGGIDLMEIHVDGLLVDDNLSATTGDDASNDIDNNSIHDFCGGDPGGLGNTHNSLASSAVSGQLDGDLAVLRVWGGIALTPAEIAANYAVLGGADEDPPVLATLVPAAGATGVYRGTEIVANFNENVSLTGAGTITVTDGTDTRVINLDGSADDGDATLVDKTLTITLDTQLSNFNSSYEVTISSGAIEDQADTPNPYPGTTSGEWTFTTAAEDLVAPVISSTDPADDAINIAPGVNLVATFDKDIVLGSGTITLVDLTDGSGDQTISVPGANVSVSGAVLTVDPPADLEGATDYAVQLGADVVRNFSDVGNAAITDTITWNFTATDTTVYSGATGSFNKDTWNDPNNWSAGVPNGGLNAIIDNGEYASVSVAYSLVPCPAYTGDLTLNQNATLEIASGSNDTDLNAFGTGTITMNQGSEIAFRRSADSTHANDIVVAGDAEIDLCRSTSAHVRDRTFNGEISGSGRLSIFGESRNNGYFNGNNASWSGGLRAYNGNSMVFGGAADSLGTGDVTIDDGMSLGITAADAMGDSATLTLSGNPGSDNGSARSKLVMSANDTVGMLVRNGFPYPAGTYGASGSGAASEVSWISGTGILTVAGAPVETTAPGMVSLSPADDTATVFVAERFIIEFDEPMAAGSGNILVKNLTDATTITVPAADTWQVSITDTQVVIDLLANLAAGKDYAIQIESTAFTDLFGNAYAGITDDVSWNFTTVGTKTFGEGFESPDVTAAQSDGNTSGAIPTGWVGANQGFGGSRRGIVDEAHGDFTDPVGEQAFAFRYTNSGLTTAEGVICTLLAGTTYTVSFDVVMDGHNDTTPYTAQLIAFADGAARNDARSTPSGSTVLASKTGNSTVDGLYTNVSFSFTATAANAADLGKDVGLRFKGASSTAIIDNVVVTVTGEAIAPVLVSIVDDVAGGPVDAPDPVTYTVTFGEPMDVGTIGTDDFENGASGTAAGVTIDSVVATADPSVYEVTVTTASAGDLLLQVKAGAFLTDANGNPLDTTAAIADDTTILVEAAPYDTWASANGLADGDADTGADTESPTPDGLNQLLEFAFGTDPNASDNSELIVTDGSTFTPGTPKVEQIFSGGNPIKLRYVRLKDYAAAGLTYTPEFYDSSGAYQPATAPVTTQVSDAGGDYEVVEVEFPIFDSTGEKASALVGRVVVELAP